MSAKPQFARYLLTLPFTPCYKYLAKNIHISLLNLHDTFIYRLYRFMVEKKWKKKHTHSNWSTALLPTFCKRDLIICTSTLCLPQELFYYNYLKLLSARIYKVIYFRKGCKGWKDIFSFFLHVCKCSFTIAYVKQCSSIIIKYSLSIL